jgi:hypothetical protein
VSTASPRTPSPFRRTGLAAWLLLASLLAAATPSPAQTSESDAARTVEEVTGEPFIDRNVGSVLERFSSWRARMKKEHFTTYLIVYTALLGTVVGGTYGFLAFRFGDAMAPYRRIRYKTGLLALAGGFGLGVLTAVTQVPPTIPGKVTILLMTIGCAVVATTLSALLLFVIQRWFMVARARRSGFPLSGRLRVP